MKAPSKEKYIQWVTTLSLTIRYTGLSSFVVASQICEILRKFEFTAVQGVN